MIKKDLHYYLNLPYNRVVQFVKDIDGDYYLSKVTELEGCFSTGKTSVEALENLQEAFEGYLEVKLEYNDPIPEPVSS